MVQSKGTVISVKIPIRWDVMTKRQRNRLSRITSRDTRVIQAALGVIERHESELRVGKKLRRIDSAKLRELTLTATRGDADRPVVEHDFKSRFSNTSVNELQACLDTARAMWESYLVLGGKRPLHSKNHSLRKLPRYIFSNCFDFVYSPELEIRHWLSVRDSLDSARQGRRVHDKLMIPLNPSSYHLTKLKTGDAKSVRILKDRSRKWWAVFSVRLPELFHDLKAKPPAVLGVDLGIRKAVCSVMLTQRGLKQVEYWTQKEKVQRIIQLESQVASLQRKRDQLLNSGKDASAVKKKLKEIGNKREKVSIDHDRKLVKMLAQHITEASHQYDLFVAIGKVRGIRSIARKGNRTGSRFRGMIHRWAFHRLTASLKHKLSTMGFDISRMVPIPESWTSIMCHKCGHKGIRPKQSYFLCHTCGYRDNADKNAATNIGRRLIKLIPSLRDGVAGLGMWLFESERATPKAKRSKRSERMSSLSESLPDSSEGESVVDCNDQTTIESFESSTDPTMEKTVEMPSASRTSGNTGQLQRKEALSQWRNYVPMILSKDHVTVQRWTRELAGDGSRDKGGTQKSEVIEELSSPGIIIGGRKS